MDLTGGTADSSDLAWRKERFRGLYEEYQTYVWRYCQRRLFDSREAEEAFNSTFLTVWQLMDELPESDRRRAWLTLIARNHMRNSWRKTDRYDRLLHRLQGQRADTKSRDAADLAPSSGEPVVEAINQLKEADQEILRLAAWEELSHREIAEILGCRERAVAVRLHRARKRLAVEMQSTIDAETNSDAINLDQPKCVGLTEQRFLDNLEMEKGL